MFKRLKRNNNANFLSVLFQNRHPISKWKICVQVELHETNDIENENVFARIQYRMT